MPPANESAPTPWSVLPPGEQLRLREQYGRHLDTQPRTCDLELKLERFRAWLAERGVVLDLHR
jgi:hypothetical protein